MVARVKVEHEYPYAVGGTVRKAGFHFGHVIVAIRHRRPYVKHDCDLGRIVTIEHAYKFVECDVVNEAERYPARGVCLIYPDDISLRRVSLLWG